MERTTFLWPAAEERPMSKDSKRLRCAIYTRKSTDEGLDQPFNSLDAQRAACEAYILSQAGEGWDCLPAPYDDGGWSGGNLERPALQALMDQISKGRVDIVVVYKVDRLTRSLMDFAKIVETFDKHQVSFVSVTQAFNTTNSMGRLTLNVLLSFAQFEREVTAERIRDKIAASKARGMWMGGHVPLGYDLGDRQLLINAQEANQVRHIYQRYLELGSLTQLAQDLDQAGIRSKRWTSRNGKIRGGLRFNCGALAYILKNRLYLGEITHKGISHVGNHDAIIAADLFDAVQAKLAANKHQHSQRRTKAASSPLHRKLFDAQGMPMQPSFGYGRGKKIYRYYVSQSLLPQGKALHQGNPSGTRVSAEQLERQIIAGLTPLARDVQPDHIFAAISKATYADHKLHLQLDVAALKGDTVPDAILLDKALAIDPRASVSAGDLHLTISAPPLRKGQAIIAHLPAAERHNQMSKTLRMAHQKLKLCHASPAYPSTHNQMTVPQDKWTREHMQIAFLAPDIQKAILQGRIASHVDEALLLSPDLPLDWKAQRKFLGMEA